MGTVPAVVRRYSAVACVLVMSMVALALPESALAANTASFSSRTPGSASSTTDARPTISVKVYDPFGVRGAGSYAMLVDDVAVSPSMSYTVIGSWNPAQGDYRRLKVSYTPATALGYGKHTVEVRIIDQKNKRSSTRWSFTVRQPVNTATFSSPVPAPGSESEPTRPLIAVSVYDRYGIRGKSSVLMRIDGRAVTPSFTYARSGDYRTLRLTYRPAAAMALSSHTVQLVVKDQASKESTYAWTFDVIGPEPVYDPMPAPGERDCASCHAGYPAIHPMQSCGLCHADDAPLRPQSGLNPGQPMTPYTPADVSAHSLACSLEPVCHGGEGNSFPHVLDSDCARCHNAMNPKAPSGHVGGIEAAHQSGSATCVGRRCHVSSLTIEHYRRTVGGQRLSCVSCHGSTNDKVVKAIEAGSTACDSCHAFGAGTHPGTAVAHNITAACATPGCHDAEASLTHKGNCTPCHAPGRTPSLTCGDCHVAADLHQGAAGAHTAPEGGCVGRSCHAADVTQTHKANCSRCHATGRTPSLVCTASCHESSKHKTITAHTSTQLSCVSGGCHASNIVSVHADTCVRCHAPGMTPSADCTTCHGNDVTTIHVTPKHDVAAGGACVNSTCHGDQAALVHAEGPGCSACHRSGSTPTLDCGTCHAAGMAVLHADGDGKHDAPANTCVDTGCHPSSVFDVHVNGDSCASCHWTGEQLSITCADCHDGDLTALHSSADASHTAPIDTGCIKTGCHVESNVATLHSPGPRCAACHGPAKTPSKTCADCHADDQSAIHSDGLVAHEIQLGACVGEGCHDSSAPAVHHDTCTPCHRPDRAASIVCADCHSSDIDELHASAEASHTAGYNGCNFSACHPKNVSTVHEDSEKKCAACHASTQTPSLICSDCHTMPTPDIHGFALGLHTILGGTCVGSGCHGTDVTAIHDGGPGCEACHADDTTPTIECTVCHGSDLDALHATEAHTAPTSACVDAGCHGSTVTTLHRDARNGCMSCHAPDKTPSTDCGTCHSMNVLTVHQDADTAHVIADNTCVNAECHVTNAATLHAAGDNCQSCHRPGETASLQCATCHLGDLALRHPFADEEHTVASGDVSCVNARCHAPNLASLHTNGPACSACHGPTVQTGSECASCHPGGTTTLHAQKATKHTAPDGTCVKSGCHFNDVELIHQDADTGCNACHGPGRTPSLQCATCHTGEIHPGFPDAHGPQGCAATTCHYGNITTIHGEAEGCERCHAVTGTLPNADCRQCHSAYLLIHLQPVNDPHDIGSQESTSTMACTGPTCHRSAVTITHENSRATCAACHAPNVTPSKNCTGCHTSVPIIAAHEAIPGRHDVPASNGCYWRCHFDPALEPIEDPGLAEGCQCHSGPVSQETTPRASVPATTTLAGVHIRSASCAACHAQGVTASNQCIACHDDGGGEITVTEVPIDEWSSETVTTQEDNHSDYHYRSCNYCHVTAHVTGVYGHSGSTHAGGHNVFAPVIGAGSGSGRMIDADGIDTFAECSMCHGQGRRVWSHPNPWKRVPADGDPRGLQSPGDLWLDADEYTPARSNATCHCNPNLTFTVPF